VATGRWMKGVEMLIRIYPLVSMRG